MLERGPAAGAPATAPRRRRLSAFAADRCRRPCECAPVPPAAGRVVAVCVAVPDVDGDPTAAVDAACAIGSVLPSEDGVSLGDVVVSPAPPGLLGVLPPAGDSEGSLPGALGEVEPLPELEALTLGVVMLTAGVVTVTLGTVTVTLGTDTDVSPRTGRLGNVTGGSVTGGSDSSISEESPEDEKPDGLTEEDEPERDESNPAA